jgi:hypothetical protein
MASGASSAHQRTHAEGRTQPPRKGLLEFDLGLIPASVTPPRSSRHAAWFAIGSSIVAGIGLAIIATAVVYGPARSPAIEALPGLPSMRLGTAPPPSGSPQVPAAALAPVVRAAPGRGIAIPAAATTGQTRAPGPTPAQAPTANQPTVPTTTRPAQVVARPAPLHPRAKRVLHPAAALPAALVNPSGTRPNATVLGDRAEAFYQQVVTNPAAAFTMTAGPLRQQGVHTFRLRYADVARIELRHLTINPANATVLGVMTVLHRDGSRTVESRLLTFWSSQDPHISSETPC